MNQQRDESGILFKNDRKEADNHPDYKGESRIGGKDYWVSAWIKTGKSGQKFMSFAYTEKGAELKRDIAENGSKDLAKSFNADEDMPF